MNQDARSEIDRLEKIVEAASQIIDDLDANLLTQSKIFDIQSEYFKLVNKGL